MRHLFILTLLLVVLNACGQKGISKVTVVFYDNQNPSMKLTVDTLLRFEKINLVDTPIDIFYANKNFHLPCCVPTGGIYKNADKDNECDMTIYPQNVKCYEYDDKKRVVKMTVNGSGTLNNFTYEYNDKNQITEISDLSKQFNLQYNSDGTLSKLTQRDGVINKSLVFIYD